MTNSKNQTSPFFSIIMPAFNAEDYIAKAIKSVLKQEYTFFELIIINDGSSDKTLEIIHRFCNIDSRIVVINLAHNAEPSNARNQGMYRVQGKYITFVDADDYIDCDLLSSIYRAVTKYKFPEAVKYGFCEEYYNSKNTLVLQKRVVFPAEFVMTAQDVRKSILQEMPYFFGYTCNTFYKTISLQLSSLKFEKINMIEDYIFNVAYFENITTFAVVDIGAYHYCKRPNNSLSSKVVEDYFIVSSKRINIWLEKAQSWGLLDKNLLDNIFWTYTRYVYSAICRMLVCSQKESSRQELENIYHTELFNQFSHIEFSNCTLKQKIMTMFLQRRCSRTVIFMCSCFNLMRTHLPKFFAMFKD